MNALGSDALSGMGMALVREREMACKIQDAIERYYGLDRVAHVKDFVAGARSTGRETLLVHHAEDGAIEMRLELPQLPSGGDLDEVCQIIEGVSHFVYVATRASQDRTTSALELEIQAEVDKYIVLAGDVEELDVSRSEHLRARLYERVRFVHASETEMGERYRTANRVASRFLQRMEMKYVAHRRFDGLRRELFDFFRSGQEQKLRLAA